MDERFRRAAFVALLWAIVWPQARLRADAPAKTARAVRVPAGSLRLDGRLDEDAWTSAPPLTDFVQREPRQGSPPSDPIEVRFLYDADALYVGARMGARGRAAIQAPLGRRDDGHQSEHLLVSLDTFHDRRTAYTFGVTAAGARIDHHNQADNEFELDAGFDPVWEARVHVDDAGWTAEMRIPFSQLRFNDAPSQVWGLNVDHWVPSRFEEVFWVLVPKGENAWASRFGTLTGIEGIRPSRRIELLPYAAATAAREPKAEPGDPFRGGSGESGRIGGDLKTGLGPNLTLEATFNPDFGQVEADPAEVNLTAFETFFDERRPFFTEGRSLLEFGDYVYTRRIGARPRGPADGAFVDYPAASTILGAGKLTGRLPGGFSIGALAALTQGERARVADGGSSAVRSVRVAPATGYAVVHGLQQFGRNQSTAGVILTGVQRRLESGDPLGELLPRDALAGAGHFDLRLRGGAWSLRGHAGFSHVAGEPGALLRLQTSSARYYQRPDAPRRLDPARRSLDGYRAGIELERLTARHWFSYLAADATSPGFERNDLGSLSRSGEVQGFGSFGYRETRRGRVFHEWATELISQNRWDWDAGRAQTTFTTFTNLTWLNQWRTQLVANASLRAQDTRLTRGGPAMGTPRRFSLNLTQRSRSSSRTTWRVQVARSGSENGDRGTRLNGELSWRPAPRLQLRLTPQDVRATEARQYVATLEGGRAESFGSRYVFAFIDRRTLSAQLRLTYLFKPDLSLDLYAEPFAASGRYHDYGELLRPRSRSLRRYGSDGTSVALQADGSRLVRDGAASFVLPNGDFNVRSFRSNVVLRWEWRLGSTLYAVWQQNRSGFEPLGDRASIGDVLASFGARGDNIFAVKTTFWLHAK